MKFKIYLDNGGEWRWSLVAANGRIIADSGEGYSTRQNARRAVYRLVDLMFDTHFAVQFVD